VRKNYSGYPGTSRFGKPNIFRSKLLFRTGHRLDHGSWSRYSLVEKKRRHIYSSHSFNLVISPHFRVDCIRKKLISSFSLLECAVVYPFALLQYKDVFFYEKKVSGLGLYSLPASINFRFQTRFLRKAATMRGGVIIVVIRDIPSTTA